MSADVRVPGYLGRVLTVAEQPLGTCFQVQPGILVTAWHVLDDLGAGEVGASVRVDPLAGGDGFTTAVKRIDPDHDLAVLRSEDRLPSSVTGWASTDALPVETGVLVTGVPTVSADPDHQFRYLDAPGRWCGGTTRDDQIALGRLASSDVVPGMSGGPVRRVVDDAVVGVVSARYNTDDGWLEHSVWIARTEDLRGLLAGITSIEVAGRLPLGAEVDLTFTVTDEQVRLDGAGIDVGARHAGVSSGLAWAVDDVRRARAWRPDPGSTAAEPSAGGGAVAAVRRVGELLAASFLPEPVRGELATVLRAAQRAHAAVRFGVAATGVWAGLPWEMLLDPVEGRPLALHPLVVVYRQVADTAATPATGGPLQIVVAISAPEAGDGAVLDYERELRDVVAAVRTARRAQAQVRIVPFATVSEIRAALAAEPAHVLHLSGHGEPGLLTLEDDDGAPRPLTADKFVEEAIPPGRMPPVVALSACFTDVAAGPELPSFAGWLLAHGASAVIATEASISDRYATRLFARLYATLAEAAVPDVVSAVAVARRLVHQQLTTSADPRDRLLAAGEEWAVVSVLAGHATVPVLHCTLPEEPALRPRKRARLRGVLGREVGEFVGRRRELRRWPRRLLDPDAVGLVLYGIGGIGKTTLASELAGRMLERDPGRLAVPFTGPLTADGIFAGVAAALRRSLVKTGDTAGLRSVELLGRVDRPWADRLEYLAELQDQTPLLIVLDNFEDNLQAGDGGGWQLRDPILADLLAGWVELPGLARLLITCRYPFRLPGDYQAALTFVPLGPLTRAEAMKLAWGLPGLDRLSEPELDQVWRQVGGHPRSLEYLDSLLMGGRARYPDVSRRLAAAVERALGSEGATRLRDIPTLDTALAETLTLAADDVLLDALLARLDPAAQRLLLGAAVYREPVDHPALLFQIGEPDEKAAYTPDYRSAQQRLAELLTAAGVEGTEIDLASPPAPLRQQAGPLLAELKRWPTPPRRPVPGLDRMIGALTASSLLYAEESGRVFVHRWTASELAARWGRRGNGDEVKDAHRGASDYWQWRVQVWPQDRAADVHDLLEARYHLLRCGQLGRAAQLTELVCGSLHQWGAWDQEAELIHDTLAWLPPASPRRAAWICQLGILAQDRGDYPEAERRYQQSLNITERLGDRDGMSRSYHQLGALAQLRGDYPEAGRRYQQSLNIKERLGDQDGLARSHHQLGALAQARGDYPEAERRYQQSLNIAERLGDQDGLSRIYHNLGVLAWQRRDYPEAEYRYRQSLDIKERLGDQAGLAGSYQSLGVLAQDRGDYREAERRYRQSLDLRELLGDQAGLATTLSQIGILLGETGNARDGVVYNLRALTIRAKLGVPQAQIDLRTLRSQQQSLGSERFEELLREHLDAASIERSQQMLDSDKKSRP